MNFFENLGFSNHPFVHTNADEEPFLEQYFVPPPFFDGVKGDPTQPTSVTVFAPRGSGKSAQRRQLELWAEQNAVLAVTYDRFEFGVSQNVKDIGLPYHLRNVITRTLVTYLSYLADYPDTIQSLPKTRRIRLQCSPARARLVQGSSRNSAIKTAFRFQHRCGRQVRRPPG